MPKLNLKKLTETQLKKLVNRDKKWLIEAGYIDLLVDSGYIDLLVDSGYISWLADSGYTNWLVKNGYLMNNLTKIKVL